MIRGLLPLRVKEVFYSLQGEGANVGRPAVFCRFVGCNLWSGREEDRAHALCRFCDTDFLGGTLYPEPARLALAMANLWPGGGTRFCVLTGGEPTLQSGLGAVVAELRALNFTVAIETNGTRPSPTGAWLTVSPKAGTTVVQRSGDELKVVWPQSLDLDELARWDFTHRFLQPMDGPDWVATTELAVARCLVDPRWRLSLQTHKYLNLR